jgi:PPOX class probable F420-dependent enzyme
MNVEDARSFVSQNHRAVLVTRKKNGDPQTSPITLGIDEEDKLVISSRETAYKVKNLSRDPRATLCVLNDGFFGDWMQIDGTAELVPFPEAMEGLVSYYRRISGEHPDWDEYRQAMVDQKRVLIRISIERVGPTKGG